MNNQPTLNKSTYLFSLLFLIILFSNCQKNKKENSPNIIYILADDMGYGDVSALNNQSKIVTNNIDVLAKNGMSFTDAHSNSAVCTPTRYGILTGRYAWRTWMKQGVLWSWDEPLIKPERTTVASFLKKQNYNTACVGKWHLGLGWEKDTAGIANITAPISGGPNELGFDYFYGITASLDIPPYIYIENDRSTSMKIDTVEKMDGKKFWRTGQAGDDFKHEEVLPTLTEKAIGFINKNAKKENPFFLYFPLPAPHTPILPTEKFLGKSKTNEYGDFVLMVDDVVGHIIKTLKENKIEENTLIVFTSDNGCSPMADFEELEEVGHDPSHIYRGHKADIYEGGHRVPFIVQWKNKIKPNSINNETICLTDLLATCAGIIGDTLNVNEGEDSYDLTPYLFNQKISEPIRPATVHHSINGSFAIRKNKWKLIFCPGSGGWSFPVPKKAKELALPKLQLYDLENDPTEGNNVAENNPVIVAELTRLMEQYINEGRSTEGEVQENDAITSLYLNDK